MRVKKLFINLGCALFSIVILVVGLELCFRFISYRKKSIIENFEYVWPVEGTLYKGFRGDVPKVSAPKQGYRILVLGDSYSWGDKVSDPKDIWPNVLENKLNKKYQGKNIQVINMSRCGWTTVNEMEIFLLYGTKLNADMLIVQYSLNDPLPSGKNLTRQGGSWLSEQIANKYSLVKHDNLYRRLKNTNRDTTEYTSSGSENPLNCTWLKVVSSKLLPKAHFVSWSIRISHPTTLVCDSSRAERFTLSPMHV